MDDLIKLLYKAMCIVVALIGMWCVHLGFDYAGWFVFLGLMGFVW